MTRDGIPVATPPASQQDSRASTDVSVALAEAERRLKIIAESPVTKDGKILENAGAVMANIASDYFSHPAAASAASAPSTEQEKSEEVKRLQMMIEDEGETWDLSDNDKTAISWVLDAFRYHRDRAAKLEAAPSALLTRMVAALKLANEWASKFPLEGTGSRADLYASAEVYTHTLGALSGAERTGVKPL